MKNSKKDDKLIIVADDDEDLLFIISSQLAKYGYKVQVCLGGKNLIDTVLEKKPSLLLLDIAMQDVNGGELCRAIKSDSRTQALKILLLSGNHDIANYAEANRADGYIAKPLSINDLKDIVKRYL